MRATADRLLIDDDGRAQVFDSLRDRLRVAWQEIANEQTEGLVHLPLGFRGDRVESIEDLLEPRHSREDREFSFWNAQRQVPSGCSRGFSGSRRIAHKPPFAGLGSQAAEEDTNTPARNAREPKGRRVNPSI